MRKIGDYWVRKIETGGYYRPPHAEFPAHYAAGKPIPKLTRYSVSKDGKCLDSFLKYKNALKFIRELRSKDNVKTRGG